MKTHPPPRNRSRHGRRCEAMNMTLVATVRNRNSVLDNGSLEKFVGGVRVAII